MKRTFERARSRVTVPLEITKVVAWYSVDDIVSETV